MFTTRAGSPTHQAGRSWSAASAYTEDGTQVASD